MLQKKNKTGSKSICSIELMVLVYIESIPKKDLPIFLSSPPLPPPLRPQHKIDCK